jgi:hypothetical protein
MSAPSGRGTRRAETVLFHHCRGAGDLVGKPGSCTRARWRCAARGAGRLACDLVRDKGIAPEDALPAGLSILAALADLARTSAFSVLDASA